MPIRHAIWKVGEKPVSLSEVSLGSEAMLEQMITEDLGILSNRWMLIGRQVRTSHGGIVDLLALNQDGQIIVIELKKALTPRDVVAQALDYASWVQKLEAAEVVKIYNSFSGGKSLTDAFKARFGYILDEEQLNGSHQIVVVASALDPSTERIVDYLNGLDVPINVIFFQVFQDGANQYLSRAWLIDPVEIELKASSGQPGAKGEWNGEYYVSFGHGENRNWDEAVKYGFISAGGGAWYTRTLFQLKEGDRIWVNIPGQGYVGVGKVTGEAVIYNEFMVKVDGELELFMEVAKANYHREFVDDEENSEYFVSVQWIDTKSLKNPVSEIGFFGNQNTVCRPRTQKWNFTVETLKKKFRV